MANKRKEGRKAPKMKGKNMKIQLTNSEIEKLKEENITVDTQRDYAEDEAFGLLDSIRDVEVSYAMRAEISRRDAERAVAIGDIADKVQDMIDRA